MVDVWLRGGREEGEVGEHCWCLTGILDGGITRRLCKGEECVGGGQSLDDVVVEETSRTNRQQHKEHHGWEHT